MSDMINKQFYLAIMRWLDARAEVLKQLVKITFNPHTLAQW